MGPNIYDTFSFVFIRLLRVAASFLDGDHHLVRAGSMTTATLLCVKGEKNFFTTSKMALTKRHFQNTS